MIGTERKYFTQFPWPANFVVGSGLCPTDMVITSRTVNAANAGLTLSGNSFWKKEITLSESFNFPSVTANPTAVEVKLLLVEYMVCLRSGRYGFHKVSAITFPCRISMKLWNSLLLLSRASRKLMIAEDETPSSSGILLGNEVECCA